jgi:peptidoglycan/LPS O-acetylase OafA/YrhL
MAYLFFPFALPAIWKAPNTLKMTLALILFGALAALAFISGDDFNQWDGPITLLRCLPEFLLGTLKYCAFQMRGRVPRLSSDIVALGIVGALILCLHFAAPDLFVTLLFASLILAATSNTGIFIKIMGIGALVRLGEISYSLYLVHGFVQFVATKCLHAVGIQDRSQIASGESLVLMLLMLAFCLAFATATYYSIEIVWRRYLREVFRGRKEAGPRRAAKIV